MTISPKLIAELRDGYAPCPMCGQYSHSIGNGLAAEAHLHFETMFSHRGDGIPTQRVFDDKTRDLVQRMIAALDTRPDTNSAGMREALEPFAREASEYDYPGPEGPIPDTDDAPNASSLREINDLTVGDLRRARAALNPDTPKVEG